MQMRKAKEKEVKNLTELEKKFAELFVENYFSQDSKTNTEIAKLSGYAPESAYQRGYENTTYRIKPHVVERIEELKEDFNYSDFLVVFMKSVFNMIETIVVFLEECCREND